MLYLYNLTLQKPAVANAATYGSFTAPKKHELVVAKNSYRFSLAFLALLVYVRSCWNSYLCICF